LMGSGIIGPVMTGSYGSSLAAVQCDLSSCSAVLVPLLQLPRHKTSADSTFETFGARSCCCCFSMTLLSSVVHLFTSTSCLLLLQATPRPCENVHTFKLYILRISSTGRLLLGSRDSAFCQHMGHMGTSSVDHDSDAMRGQNRGLLVKARAKFSPPCCPTREQSDTIFRADPGVPERSKRACTQLGTTPCQSGVLPVQDSRLRFDERL
jgi:hypothetical protein